MAVDISSVTLTVAVAKIFPPMRPHTCCLVQCVILDVVYALVKMMEVEDMQKESIDVGETY